MIRKIEHNTCGPDRVWKKVSPVGYSSGAWTVIRSESGWLLCGPESYEAKVHPMHRIYRTMQEASWSADEWEETN